MCISWSINAIPIPSIVVPQNRDVLWKEAVQHDAPCEGLPSDTGEAPRATFAVVRGFVIQPTARGSQQVADCLVEDKCSIPSWGRNFVFCHYSFCVTNTEGFLTRGGFGGCIKSRGVELTTDILQVRSLSSHGSC